MRTEYGEEGQRCLIYISLAARAASEGVEMDRPRSWDPRCERTLSQQVVEQEHHDAHGIRLIHHIKSMHPESMHPFFGICRRSSAQYIQRPDRSDKSLRTSPPPSPHLSRLPPRDRTSRGGGRRKVGSSVSLGKGPAIVGEMRAPAPRRRQGVSDSPSAPVLLATSPALPPSTLLRGPVAGTYTQPPNEPLHTSTPLRAPHII